VSALSAALKRVYEEMLDAGSPAEIDASRELWAQAEDGSILHVCDCAACTRCGGHMALDADECDCSTCDVCDGRVSIGDGSECDCERCDKCNGVMPEGSKAEPDVECECHP
jgi:hypothetical protein